MADHKKLLDFFQSEGGTLMSFAFNLLRNRADAEDACQEMILQMIRHWDEYDGRENLKGWAYTILYRKCLDQLKKRKRFLNFFNRATRLITSREAGPDIGEFEDSLPEKILNRLSTREKACLILWAREGLSSEEIGAILGLKPGTVRVHLYQARRKIKQLMERGNEKKVQLFSG